MPTSYGEHNHDTTALDTAIANLKTDLAAQDARIRALEGGTPPPPPPVPAPLGGVYGPAINCDSKSNLQVGWTNRAKLSHRFRSTSSSVPVTIRFAQRGGSGYSGGTGGKLKVMIQGDIAGEPNGVIYGLAAYGPKVPSGGIFDSIPVGAGLALTKGLLYHVVYENVDANPVANYISLNHLFVFGAALQPRQPKFPDTDMAVLYGGTPWSLEGQFTPVFDLTYADGTHDGQGYVGMIGINNQAVYASSVSGTRMARQTMAPTQDVVFTSASVRLRRTGGNSPLSISLGGQLLGTISAASVPITTSGGDNGGSVWATTSWLGPVTLKAGQASGLYFTSPADTTYTLALLRSGTDSGFAPSLSFSEGTAQESTDGGATWKDIYSSPLDYQCYVR